MTLRDIWPTLCCHKTDARRPVMPKKMTANVSDAFKRFFKGTVK